MASTIRVDALQDTGANDIITSDGSGTFTYNGIAASAIDSGTIATARLGSGTASSSTVLYGDQTYKAEPGGANTPAFEAYLGDSMLSIADNTWTKVEFDTEVFDTDGDYDNSTNYRFTPQTAGKYCCYADVYGTDYFGIMNVFALKFHFNGAQYQTSSTFKQDYRNNPGNTAMVTLVQTIDFDGSSDYLEVYCLISTGTSPDIGQNSAFGAYKLIGA